MARLNEEAIEEMIYLINEVGDVVRLLEEFRINITSDPWTGTSFCDKENILTWSKIDLNEINNDNEINIGDVFYIGGNVITGYQHEYKNKWIVAPKKLAEVQGEIFKDYLQSIINSVSLKHFELVLDDPNGLIDNCGWEHYISIDAIVKKSAIIEDYQITKKVIEEIRKEYECYTYTAFNDNYDNIKTVNNLIGYDDKYACMIEVFSDLVTPNKENQEFYGISDKYIDRVVEIRDDMREMATSIEHHYNEEGVKVTLSKWNQGCEFGMAMYIWIPFQ